MYSINGVRRILHVITNDQNTSGRVILHAKQCITRPRLTPPQTLTTAISPPHPPMSRRNIITSADGWSNVIGKRRAPLRNPSRHLAAEAPAPPSDYAIWAAATQRTLSAKCAELAASALLRTVETALATLHGPIRNVVVLGLGSLCGNTRDSSFYQLALVYEICALLSTPLQCYFQDPAFTATDIRFFQDDRGNVVLQHPEAETHIGAETLLYAPHLEYEVLQAALKCRPAFVFCNDLQNFLDTKIAGADEYAVFEDYIRTHKCVVLQNVDGHDHIGGGRAFNHSALYWHKQLVVPDMGELGRKGCGPDAGDKPRGAITDNTGSKTKTLDEGVQEIISNMKTHFICFGNSEILIKRYQKGTNVLVTVTKINSRLEEGISPSDNP